jgi:hypothetical protein
MAFSSQHDHLFQPDDRWTENTAEALVILFSLGKTDSDEICDTLGITLEEMHYLLNYVSEVYGSPFNFVVEGPAYPGFDFDTPM